jgi:hypothetical protein
MGNIFQKPNWLFKNLRDPKFYEEAGQFAFSNHGTEKIVHLFRRLDELFPHLDKYFMDGETAYNNGNRDVRMHEMLKHHPAAIPFMRMLYGTKGHLWYHGLPEGIQPVSSEWGYQQGGAEANDGYCTATRPFHMALQDMLKNEPGLLAEYVDDLNAATDFQRMILLIEKVLELGPKYGYILRMDKGSYLMAKCDTDAEANERYNRLLAIGLDPNIIHIHPDNVADPAEKLIAAKRY